MFTGIVRDVGRIRELDAVRAGRPEPEHRGRSARSVATQRRRQHRGLGRVPDRRRACSRGPFVPMWHAQTLAVTTIGRWTRGRRVNLEPALRAGEALGGHLVAGHVDGIGELLARRGRCALANSASARARDAAALCRAQRLDHARWGELDGQSGRRGEFELNLVPHTLAVTTLGELAVGDRVNVEIDLIARYVERLVQEQG